jgi:hypothetical protein
VPAAIEEDILEFISQLCVTYTVMVIMYVVSTVMLSDIRFPHKCIGNSVASEHLLYASRIRGHKM